MLTPNHLDTPYTQLHKPHPSYLQVLPAAATGEVLYNQPVVCADRRSIPIPPSPAIEVAFKVTKTASIRVGDQLVMHSHTHTHRPKTPDYTDLINI